MRGYLLAFALLAGTTATAAPTKCPVQGCGSNTPELSASYFIEKLNLDGLPDENGTRYVPRSFRCKGNDKPLDLRVRNGALFGVNAQGRKVCPDVRGASFLIETLTSPKPPKSPRSLNKRIKITITAVGQAETWHLEPSRREILPTYRFTWPKDNLDTSFCPQRDASWMEPWQQTTPHHTPRPGEMWHERTDHLLILQGETYTEAAKADPERSGRAWISLGCAGAAFSKMRLLGYDPMSNTSTIAEREATLKMITARYKDAESHTIQGVALAWISLKGAEYEGTPAPESLGRIEALWGPDGAICLSHLRLFQKGRTQDYAAPEVNKWYGLGIPTCDSLDSFSGVALQDRIRDSPPRRAMWATITVDHISHIPLPLGPPVSVPLVPDKWFQIRFPPAHLPR